MNSNGGWHLRWFPHQLYSDDSYLKYINNEGSIQNLLLFERLTSAFPCSSRPYLLESLIDEWGTFEQKVRSKRYRKPFEVRWSQSFLILTAICQYPVGNYTVYKRCNLHQFIKQILLKTTWRKDYFENRHVQSLFVKDKKQQFEDKLLMLYTCSQPRLGWKKQRSPYMISSIENICREHVHSHHIFGFFFDQHSSTNTSTPYQKYTQTFVTDIFLIAM